MRTAQRELADLREEFRKPARGQTFPFLNGLLRRQQDEDKAPVPPRAARQAPRKMPGKLKISFKSAIRRSSTEGASVGNA